MIAGRLVIASDGSPAAQEAERLAASLAAQLKRNVDILIVPEVSGGAGFAASGSVLPLDAKIDADLVDNDIELREAVARVRELIEDPAVAVRGFLLEGASPARAIIGYCEASTEPIAAIVMGNRGKGGLPRLLMGSVSDQVLKSANCPVIIVKA